MSDEAMRRALRHGLSGWSSEELQGLRDQITKELAHRWRQRAGLLSSRAKKALNRADVIDWDRETGRWEDLTAEVARRAAALSEVEYRATRDCGTKTLAELRAWLCRHGFMFKGETAKAHDVCPNCAGAEFLARKRASA